MSAQAKTEPEIRDEIARLNVRVNTLYARLMAASDPSECQLLSMRIDATQGALHALHWAVGEFTHSTYGEGAEITEAACTKLVAGE